MEIVYQINYIEIKNIQKVKRKFIVLIREDLMLMKARAIDDNANENLSK